MLGEKKRTVTGQNWSSQPPDDLRIFTNRLAKAHLEPSTVAYLDVDGGDITAYVFHKDATHQPHPEGHCEKPAWAIQSETDGKFVCSCGREMEVNNDTHEFCLKAVVI